MLDYNGIGKRIRKYRKHCGYTQEELGLSINTSGPYISNLERAVKKPSLENLAEIAEVLGITLDELVYPPHTNPERIEQLGSLVRHRSPEDIAKLISHLHDIINILEQEN